MLPLGEFGSTYIAPKRDAFELIESVHEDSRINFHYIIYQIITKYN